jgi:hypothetical protein
VTEAGAAAPLIQAYLDRRGKPGEQLPNGVVAVPLSGPDFDSPWQLWLASGGPDGGWLVAQVRAAHRVPRERWPQAIGACNAWNAGSPLAKAWLAVDDWDTAADGGLVLEASLPLVDSPPAEVVDTFLDALTRDAAEFWRALLPAAS